MSPPDERPRSERGPLARAQREIRLIDAPVPNARPSRAPSVRDMDLTAFAKILSDLVMRVPGAYASALVDQGGETVDYAGAGDPFEMKVAAAHIRIILNDLEELGDAHPLGSPRSIVVRGARRSVIGRRLPEGYALVVLLHRRAGFATSERAFSTCERLLAKEAGWAAGKGRPWFPVRVEVDRRGRPTVVGNPPIPVEVFGAIVDLPRQERGFRVRLRGESGGELTLVREPGHAWYADEDPEALRTPA